MTDYLEAQRDEWTRYTSRYSGHESVSGPGSTLEFTAPLRTWLPQLFNRHHIRTILDAGCGDFHWLAHVNLDGITYTGWDIEPNIIARNQHGYPQHAFRVVNLLTVDRFPAMDLIITRDVLIHLPNEHVTALLDKIRASNSRYLLASNFTGANNCAADPHDCEGFWYRPTDLEAEPFNLTGRVESIGEPGREPGREMVLFEL